MCLNRSVHLKRLELHKERGEKIPYEIDAKLGTGLHFKLKISSLMKVCVKSFLVQRKTIRWPTNSKKKIPIEKQKQNFELFACLKTKFAKQQWKWKRSLECCRGRYGHLDRDLSKKEPNQSLQSCKWWFF